MFQKRLFNLMKHCDVKQYVANYGKKNANAVQKD